MNSYRAIFRAGKPRDARRHPSAELPPVVGVLSQDFQGGFIRISR